MIKYYYHGFISNKRIHRIKNLVVFTQYINITSLGNSYVILQIKIFHCTVFERERC